MNPNAADEFPQLAFTARHDTGHLGAEARRALDELDALRTALRPHERLINDEFRRDLRQLLTLVGKVIP